MLKITIIVMTMILTRLMAILGLVKANVENQCEASVILGLEVKRCQRNVARIDQQNEMKWRSGKYMLPY
jgi:hypothetical protein